MVMVARAKEWTLDELHRLPEDGNKYELVFGELFVTPAPSEDHEMILVRLTELLVPYVKANALGVVFRPRAIVRFRGSEVEPDLFVRPPRPAVRRTPVKDWDDAPSPLLVVEVLSPTTRRRDVGAKRDLYLSAGAGEYWVIDPDERCVRVIRAAREDTVVGDTLIWSPHGADPLSVDVSALFG